MNFKSYVDFIDELQLEGRSNGQLVDTEDSLNSVADPQTIEYIIWNFNFSMVLIIK